jgi:hypothetical protein
MSSTTPNAGDPHVCHDHDVFGELPEKFCITAEVGALENRLLKYHQIFMPCEDCVRANITVGSASTHQDD